MADVTIRPQGAPLGAEIDLDDGELHVLDWEDTDWGKADQPDPEEEQGAEGVTVFEPLDQSWKRRTMKIVVTRIHAGHFAKRYGMSLLTRLFQGKQTIRRFGWEMDVTFKAPDELGATKRSPEALMVEAVGTAQPPFWRHIYTLQEIQWGAYLYPDFGVPPQEAQPAFVFARNLAGANAISTGFDPMLMAPTTGPHFTMRNWGTAFCYPAASITGGPPNTDLYFRGLGRYRIKVRTNGSGAATLREADRFYLAPGDNPIRLESANGTAINLTGYGSMRIDFGATKLREL